MDFYDASLKTYFGWLKVKNVFSSTTTITHDKIDTSSFAQKPYLRTDYIESSIEGDIDMKNQNRIKKNRPKKLERNNLEDLCWEFA